MKLEEEKVAAPKKLEPVKQEEEPSKAKIIDAYWIDEDGEKRRDFIDKKEVTLYLKAEDFTSGENLSAYIEPDEGQEFSDGKSQLEVSGVVRDDGIIVIDKFKIDYK